jgi:uncharacterized membrane protein
MCVSVAAGATPFYRIARRRLGSDLYAGLVVIDYLLLPAVETACAWDIHVTCFALPLVLTAVDAAKIDKPRLWWLASLMAMGIEYNEPTRRGEI